MNEKIISQIEKWMGEGIKGLDLAQRYSGYIDNFLSDILNSVDRDPSFVLMATGGYGRQELAPFSDIDIMFFARDRTNSERAERVLYALWDSGLEISHSFRTAGESIDEAFRDIRTRTSLLESRFIAGNVKLYNSFRTDVYPVIAGKKKRSFISDKLQEMEKRHLESGDSVFLLEPHIKEGEGGLRDIHTLFWLLRVAFKFEKLTDLASFISEYDYRNLLKAYDFMLQARYCLHLESRRRNDVLSFEYQRNVASCLGFADSKKFSGAERMLRYYYLKSNIIKDIARKVMVLCSSRYQSVFRSSGIKKITDEFFVSAGRLILARRDLLGTHTDRIMEGFYLYSKTGRKFSYELRDNIRAHLMRINKRARSSPVWTRYFLEIFRTGRVYETLREMHDTGVLGRFVPEFGALRCLVVHEPYHMYTVDEHTLVAIRNLENLKTTNYKHLEELREIISGMKDVDLLFIALLFHDIGKASGKRHEEEGYRRLKNILDRFNIEVDKRTTIEFLVKNHILMARLALTRETSDLDVIARFADTVGDLDRLKALYLMTYADMSAVNPRFWSSWKAYLLRDMYLSAREYLSGFKEDRTQYLNSLQSYSPDIPADDLLRFIAEMPDRYLLSTSKSKVIADYRLKKKAEWDFFSMSIEHRPDGITEVVICTKDSPGLFSKIVGFLSSRQLNIFGGNIFTGSGGIILDKIAVSNWKDIWWEGLEKDIEEGLRGIIVDEKPFRFVQRRSETSTLFDLFVELDNETSTECSVVEIFAQDRLGLLYDISTVMYERGIDIVSARIHTESGLAQDIFYVQADDSKINGTLIQELLSALWTLLRK